MEEIQQNLAAKDRVIQTLAVEVGRLKRELQGREKRLEQPDQPSVARNHLKEAIRVTIRLGASRILLDQRLVVACLDITRDKRQAALQLNFVREERILPVLVKIGQSVHFDLNERKYAMILEDLRSNAVVLKIIEQP